MADKGKLVLGGFDRFAGTVVDRPKAVLFGMLLITVYATIGYVDPAFFSRMATSTEVDDDEVAASQEEFEAPPDVDPINLGDAHAVVLVESDSFFSPNGSSAIRSVVASLESLDYVDSILWMDEVPVLNIFGLPEPLLPKSTASQQRFDAAQEKALRHPLVRGQLMSDDGRALVLLVNFDFLFVEDDADCIARLRTAAEKAAVEFPDVEMTFGITGRVPIYVTARQTAEANVVTYQLIGYGMIAFMAVLLFRGVAAVVIVALAPSLGVFWTLGILRYFDLQDNPFNDVVLPVLLSLVGLTDGVHLMVQIRRHRAEGKTPKESARRGIQEVGLACGLTSFTTAIGLGSLSLAHHEIVREFGWSCVLGVILTFLAVVTSIPLACSSRLGKSVHRGHQKGLIDRHLTRIAVIIDLVLARTRLLSIAAIALTFILLAVSFSLRPDEKTANILPIHSETAETLARMDDVLGGLEFAAVDVNWSNQIRETDPQILAVLREVDELLQREEMLGHPISICSLLDTLPGEGDDADRMSMLELLPPPLKRAFYTPEYRSATVSFRVRDIGIAKYGPVFSRIQSELDRLAVKHPEFEFDMTGSAVWRWENLYQIVMDLAKSLGSATVIIFVVLAFVYRSIRIGLISIIPNVFPLAVTGTYLVVTGQALELVSVCAFTVCLGIAVDDSIHFLTRFVEEQKIESDIRRSIRRAFTTVGTALIMTTIVLVAGFSTVLFSDTRDHRIFASMSGLTIAAALFADLIFLPALLARYAHPSNRGS